MEHRFAKKELGQNFLADQGVIDRIVRALDPTTDDLVLEIGPGRGALTAELLKHAGRVYALEFDEALAPLLNERFSAEPNFRLIGDDALSFDFRSIETRGKKLRLVANLPYNISTAILQRLFDYPDVLSDCVLMFQREVVDRITAAPATKERGFLTVLTEAHFAVERLFDVPPGAFRPVPKVWSSVVRLLPKPCDLADDLKFRELVSTAFSQKRKTILNNLKYKYPDARSMLSQAGIDPERRAETLTLDEWVRLSKNQ